MNTMEVNKVQPLVNLPKGTKLIGCTEAIKKKTNMVGTIQKYKAKLVAKGHDKVKGIDYEKTFLPFTMVNPFKLCLLLLHTMIKRYGKWM